MVPNKVNTKVGAPAPGGPTTLLHVPTIMTTRRALATIVGSWILAGIVGFLPVVGWNRGEPEVPRCIFMQVIDMKYMAFNCLVVIFVPFTVMLVLYGFIYRAIRKQVRLKCMLKDYFLNSYMVMTFSVF